MPIVPTPGADAVAAGMDLVPGSGLASDIDEYINQTRDYIAQRTSTVTPVAKGGTGANTAAGARTNLDVPSKSEAVTANSSNTIKLGWNTPVPLRLNVNIDGSTIGPLAYTSDIPPAPDLSGYINTGGGTITGTLYMPNLAPAGSGYVAMYRNSDGRVSISPSSARFKKDIKPRPYTVEQLQAIRVVDYRLRAEVYGSGDAPVDVGVIAEELIDAGLGEFVAYDNDGEPLTVHYERLALVAIGALQELATEVDLLAQRLEALENR